MHLQPVFKNDLVYVNGISEELFDKGLCLPSDTNMTSEEQEIVIKEIKNII